MIILQFTVAAVVYCFFVFEYNFHCASDCNELLLRGVFESFPSVASELRYTGNESQAKQVLVCFEMVSLVISCSWFKKAIKICVN